MSLKRYTFHYSSLPQLIAGFAICLILSNLSGDAAAQSYRYSTTNFIVTAPDPNFAKKIGNEAERFRKELAIEWLNTELQPWSEKCPINVRLAQHAGGETSFSFSYMGQQRGEPTQWDMKIFGTPERLLDSVLPHEVTHTIFATHFRRPLPRWADEGACTTVEHTSEKTKNHGMLIHFLTSQPSRGIPFNRMFTMKDYPRDILPLYAQGFSVAKFLIMEKGRKHFLDYVKAGLDMESPGNELNAWDRATQQYYGYRDLSELQVKWEGWVAAGSKVKPIPSNNALLASKTNAPSHIASKTAQARPVARATPSSRTQLASLNEGWYAKQMKVGRSYRPASEGKNERDALKPESSTIWR
jgi:hypothetical protein